MKKILIKNPVYTFLILPRFLIYMFFPSLQLFLDRDIIFFVSRRNDGTLCLKLKQKNEMRNGIYLCTI